MSKGSQIGCKRCGYVWTQRGDKEPVRCANPKCRSPYYRIEIQTPNRSSLIREQEDGKESNELHQV